MREEVKTKLLESKSESFILELCTGFGKTYLALSKIKQWYDLNKDLKVLIAIPKLILEDNWKAEMNKFGFSNLIPNVKFSTYVSLPKHANEAYDVLVLDEGHHTSERCMTALPFIKCKHMLVLSATLKKEHKYFFTSKYKTEIIKVDTKDAIKNDILPDPKLLLIPLTFNNTIVNNVIERNTKNRHISTPIKTIGYIEKWKYRSYKGPLRILCTQQQYYDDLCGLIEWYKQKGMHNAIMKNMWLHKAGERLKWLAEQKEAVVKNILKNLRNYRTLVYCPSIEDSTKLGSPCINSKVGTANLDLFNARKIKHIAAVGMLDEGANLTECKVGIFQMINSSDRLNIQRQGRLFRHKSPVLIFPYFKYSREEEIVKDIVQNYNPDLITTMDISAVEDIKNYL